MLSDTAIYVKCIYTKNINLKLGILKLYIIKKGVYIA